MDAEACNCELDEADDADGNASHTAELELKMDFKRQTPSYVIPFLSEGR